MINLQKHKSFGLTFVEVLLALFIMGSLLTSLFLAQNAVLSKVSYYSMLTDAIVLSKKKLFNVWLDQQKNVAKKVSNEVDGSLELSYKEKDLKNAPSFKKFPHIWMQQIISSWRDLRGEHKEVVVNFVFKPEAKE